MILLASAMAEVLWEIRVVSRATCGHCSLKVAAPARCGAAIPWESRMRNRLSSAWHEFGVRGRRRAIVAGAAVLLVALIGVRHFSAKADDTQTMGAGPK